MKKEIQIYILELLILFKVKFKDGNINLQVGDDNRLWLWLPINGVFQSIIFDENYEDKTPKEVFDSIILDLKDAGYNI